MPVRSLSSSVFKWPDLPTVREALRRWVAQVVERRDDVLRIGCFGSCARGDWGVGSDLDLVIVVADAEEPFERRAAGWDTGELPVPSDVLVYTEAEWRSFRPDSRFHRMLMQEADWLYLREN